MNIKSIKMLSTIVITLSGFSLNGMKHSIKPKLSIQITEISSISEFSPTKRAVEKLQESVSSPISPSRQQKEAARLMQKAGHVSSYDELHREVLSQLMNKKGWEQYKNGSYKTIAELITNYAKNQPKGKQRLLEVLLTNPKEALIHLGNKHAEKIADDLNKQE